MQIYFVCVCVCVCVQTWHLSLVTGGEQVTAMLMSTHSYLHACEDCAKVSFLAEHHCVLM